MSNKMKEMVGGCCVCSDERGWAENPLVYCDGHQCNVAVHQACYGIVSVPQGPWFCRKCESQERQARVRCELCPSKDGALKKTDNHGWAHVVCALYIPEVRFGDVATMEPILLAMIPPDRFHKTCYICEEQGKESKASIGACMQCNKPGCKQNFHVTCAQGAGLLCEEKSNYNDNVKYCGYCSHHYQKLKDGSNIKTIPAFKPVPSADSTPESEKRSQSSLSTSTPNGTASSSDTVRQPKKKNSKSNSSASSSLSGSSTPNGPTSISTGHSGLGSRLIESTLDERVKSDKKKRPSTASVTSSASQSPLAPSASPNPVNCKDTPMAINRTNSTSTASHYASTLQSIAGSNQNASPNSTPNFSAMYGSFAHRESLTKTTNLDREKEQDDKSSLPKKMKATKASKAVKRPVQSTGALKQYPTKSTKDTPATKPKKARRKKDLTPKEVDSDSDGDDSDAREKSSPVSKPKLSDSSNNRAQNLESSQSINSEVSDSLPVDRFPSKPLKDFAIPPPPTSKISCPPKEVNEPSRTLEQLLERQWNESASMMIEQVQNFDIAALLSCLFQLRSENDRLEDQVRQLVSRRDHLVAVNSRLRIPLNGTHNLIPTNQSSLGAPLMPNLSQQNGSTNSVSSSPLSFPSTNSGANPSPVNVFDGKSPRSSPATAMSMGNHHRSNSQFPMNGDLASRMSVFPTIPPQYNNLPDNPHDASIFQMLSQNFQNPSQSTSSSFTSSSCIRSPEKR
ncbi:uncharacterized protein LOC141858139 isoform X2 [Brevipalpus obovatus]|uniref:uncharacterized protein LOC141858139 isoform X2 n=1 Tax=Brevipalpus obovatus TaxID=246614 RepID=UPI003D9F2699